MSPPAISSASERTFTPAAVAPVPAAPHVDRLRAVVRAVTIHSADEFELAGRRVSVRDADAAAWAGFPTHPVPLVERLRQELYQHAYCRRLDAAEPPADMSTDASADGDAFARALSAANRGRDRWDAGWTAHALLPTGQVIAEKGATMRTLWPGEYVFPTGRGMGATTGAAITAFTPRESWTMQPGYYYALGAVADEQDDHDLARLYWNVTPEGAPTLVECLTDALTRFELPYRLKCQAHPAAYTRDDTAVLFVTRRHFRLAAELAAAALPRLLPYLRDRTPLFAKRLAPGVAAADDPGGGESFGTHRCALVAEGIWTAHERGEGSEEARLAAIERAFAARGLDIAVPHLERRSTDIYERLVPGA